ICWESADGKWRDTACDSIRLTRELTQHLDNKKTVLMLARYFQIRLNNVQELPLNKVELHLLACSLPDGIPYDRRFEWSRVEQGLLRDVARLGFDHYFLELAELSPDKAGLREQL